MKSARCAGSALPDVESFLVAGNRDDQENFSFARFRARARWLFCLLACFLDEILNGQMKVFFRDLSLDHPLQRFAKDR